MSTPKTARGTPCKLCMKKGANKKCHLHGGSPKKASPKKSPKYSPSTKPSYDLDEMFGTFASPKKTPVKKSPKKTPVNYIDTLPKDILIMLMFNMNKNELNAFCRTHKRAAVICKKESFKKEYLRRRSFFPDIKFVSEEAAAPGSPGMGGRVANKIFKDSNGVLIVLYYDNGKKIGTVDIVFPNRTVITLKAEDISTFKSFDIASKEKIHEEFEKCVQIMNAPLEWKENVVDAQWAGRHYLMFGSESGIEDHLFARVKEAVSFISPELSKDFIR